MDSKGLRRQNVRGSHLFGGCFWWMPRTAITVSLRTWLSGYAAVRRGMPTGHLKLPRFRDVAKLVMVAGAVDGLLDARRQTVVHFGDERADAAGVAGPFVGADLGQVGGGGVVDDVGIKAGVGAVVSKYI